MTDDNDDEEEFDMWHDMLEISCAGYCSGIDQHVIQVMEKINEGVMGTDIAKALNLDPSYVELIQYLLCSAGVCEYGTSPRCCFPDTRIDFNELIEKCKKYYRRNWERDDI